MEVLFAILIISFILFVPWLLIFVDSRNALLYVSKFSPFRKARVVSVDDTPTIIGIPKTKVTIESLATGALYSEDAFHLGKLWVTGLAYEKMIYAEKPGPKIGRLYRRAFFDGEVNE